MAHDYLFPINQSEHCVPVSLGAVAVVPPIIITVPHVQQAYFSLYNQSTEIHNYSHLYVAFEVVDAKTTMKKKVAIREK